MAHGMPDFGIYAAKKTTFNLADLADLAARLGSIVEYDRRGDVVYLDDFESSVQKYKEGVTGTSTAKLNSEYALSGSQSVKLLTEADTNKYASIDIWSAPFALGRHGAKISNSLYRMRVLDGIFILWMELSDGETLYQAAVQLNPHDETLEYYNAAEGLTVFETNFVPETVHEEVFHNMKLVVDFTTGKYVRFLFDTFSWDMSEYSFAVTADPGHLYTLITLYLQTLEDQALSNWIDNFVYTINEP